MAPIRKWCLMALASSVIALPVPTPQTPADPTVTTGTDSDSARSTTSATLFYDQPASCLADFSEDNPECQIWNTMDASTIEGLLADPPAWLVTILDEPEDQIEAAPNATSPFTKRSLSDVTG